MSWTLPGRGSGSTVLNPTIRKGDRGIAVWALQRALVTADQTGVVACDGNFGEQTMAAVTDFQVGHHLTHDGIAGPATQKALVALHISRRETGVPDGLMQGFAEMEGGWLLAPLNWSTPGGVDCGALQRRVYERDFGDAGVVQRAFDTDAQTRELRAHVLALFRTFYARDRAGTRDHYAGMSVHEKAWRLAALDHNYPQGADVLSRTPIRDLPSYWTSAQEWVSRYGFKFPDGHVVTTPLEWCHLYAGVLHAAHGHKGNVTKYVADWTP